MKKIKSLLIANRGEIACRVIKTCRKLGIATVAVYSQIDKGSVFMNMADEAVCLGEAGIGAYLDQDRIIQAANLTGADAIHPGYGLLSENPEFASRCHAEGITFIGPSPESIRVMGSKIAARELCEKIGVPVIPGFKVGGESMEELAKKALDIGYPLLIKASQGGGGIGIYRVDDPSLLEGSLPAARKKSMAVYGSDSLLIEKYLSSVRHIEFQVLGDLHGKVIHCLERECSVQRRHQKLIEESPSPAMTEPLRKKMGKAAIAIAKAVNYTNAGTVEFVLGDDGAFFFLEMNTRLQVEHPVTEAVTGLDLVEMQIAIAEGEPLPVTQADVSIKGHAIECRVYAEDPDNDFVPSAGDLLLWRAAHGARTDSGVATSSRITIDFDPLLAKVIAHADSRANAMRRMNRALKETTALGVATNIDFLSRLVTDEAFTNGRIKTDFFDKDSPVMDRPSLREEESRVLVMAAIVARFNDHEEGLRELGWQGGYHRMKYAGFLLHGVQYPANYRKKDGNNFTIIIQKDTYDVCVAGKDTDSMSLIVNNRQLRFSYALDQETVFLHSMNVGHHQLTYLSRFHSMEFRHHKKGAREAPMDGKVALVLVQPGQTIKKGQDLIIIESMKMENIIAAHEQGVVKEIFVKQGDFVKMGSILIEIDTENNP